MTDLKKRGAKRRMRGAGRGSEQALVYGIEPVRELVASAAEAVLEMLVTEAAAGRLGPEIERIRAAGGRVRTASSAEIARLAGPDASTQGVVVRTRPFAYKEVDAVIARAYDPLVVVEGVTDPRNLGALMRSCEGAGARAILLAKDRTVGVTPAAVKTSAGAWTHLEVARCGNVPATLERLKDAGYWVVALSPKGESSLYDLPLERKIALIVGGEGSGVRPLVLRRSDYVAQIPMRGRIASLNVAVAAAVALFEIARRRSTPP